MPIANPPEAPASSPPSGTSLRLRSGGLLLAAAAALQLLSLAASLTLPAPNPGDAAASRAAHVAAAAAAFRAIGVLGIIRSFALAMASALLSHRGPNPSPGAGRTTAVWAWRIMLAASVMFLAADIFNTFSLVPLAQGFATHPALYEYAEKIDAELVGLAALLFSVAAFGVFAAEIAPRHRRIGSGWIAFGLVAGAVGIPGAIGVIADRPRLAMLFVIGYLAFVPLLRLGVRIAAEQKLVRRTERVVERAEDDVASG